MMYHHTICCHPDGDGLSFKSGFLVGFFLFFHLREFFLVTLTSGFFVRDEFKLNFLIWISVNPLCDNIQRAVQIKLNCNKLNKKKLGLGFIDFGANVHIKWCNILQ